MKNKQNTKQFLTPSLVVIFSESEGVFLKVYIFCNFIYNIYEEERLKRHGNLWQKIISYENLYLAYIKARESRSHLSSVQRFEKDVEGNLKKLQENLINKTFTTSKYNIRTIYEPKKREIYSLPFYPDRIVHHALMNILAPIFQLKLIEDTYACIPGRGLHAGLVKANQFVQKNKYCLKMDIRKFYPSVCHDILYQLMEHKIKDKDTLWLIHDIIYSVTGDKNCPIGNFTSQWFGNIYLTQLDYFCKQELRTKNYIRYCDDFLIFSNDKVELNKCLKEIEQFLSDELKLVMSKKDLFQVTRGVDFLGYRYFKGYILLRKRTARGIQKRLKKLYLLYDNGKISHEKMLSHLSSVDGYISWANSYNFRNKIQLDTRLKEVRRCLKIYRSSVILQTTAFSKVTK